MPEFSPVIEPSVLCSTTPLASSAGRLTAYVALALMAIAAASKTVLRMRMAFSPNLDN
jgi:hypothetical protein